MEESNGSIQVPLLENQSNPKPPKAYFDTNIIDNYLLFWVGKFIDVGNRKTFQQDMHWGLRKEESSDYVTKELSERFQSYRGRKNPLLKALISTSKGIFSKIGFLRLISAALQYTGPLFIRLIIAYITEEERDMTKGILLVLGVVFSRIIITILNARSDILLTKLGINTSNAVNGLVYEKALKFSLIRSAEHFQGGLVNHIQVDSGKLFNLGIGIGGSIVLPISIAIGIYFMWAAVGISFLSGIGVLIIMSGVNFWIGMKFFKAQKDVMVKKDERMKITTEILNGIKYIKMSGWEQAFLQKAFGVREGELKGLRKQYIVTSLSVFSLWLTPMLITTAIFATYILIGNELTAKSAFTLVSTVMILQQPLRLLPFVISMILESKVAVDRVSKFLLADEVRLDYIKTGKSEDSDQAIKVENGNFYWLTEKEKLLKKEKEEELKNKDSKKGKNNKKDKKKKDKDKKNKKSIENKESLSSNSDNIIVTTYNSNNNNQQNGEIQPVLNNGEVQGDSNPDYKLILKDINLSIKKGSFVAILGDVGSGKSSFLFSLVGEMKSDDKKPPKIEINGDVSLVTQQPWILNGPVKDNIVFGGEFDQTRYQEAINYSCLQSDLNILINKDQTEIGEKGVNLSGGQKARIGLARALYRDSDIYLLDDPLSAVDAHVGSFILKECFVKYLENKTRVLVTHKFESLKFVDYIYIFKKGKIVEEGTLETLKDSQTFLEVEEKYKMMTKQEERIPEEESKQEEEISTELITDTSSQKVEPILEEPKLKQAVSKESTEEDKELQAKLMLDEDREVGDVQWNVWKSYFTYYGGWFYFTLVFLVMLTFITLQTGSNFWLSYWSEHGDEPGASKGFYFGVYSALGLSYAFFCLIRISMLFLQSIKCSRQIHKDMLTNIIRAPINLFFDRVPTGRVLNRLSKDLTVLDNYIATAFGSLTVNSFSLFADIVVCLIVGSVWIFPFAILFFFVSLHLQRKYMRVNREVTRLESISKSPIVSFFSESLVGLTSIRAYREQKRFSHRFHKLQEENIKNLILNAGLLSWFNLRVSFCTVFVVAPSMAVPLLIADHGSLSQGLIALLITYVISINDDIMWSLWTLANFENKLISLERCKAFTQIEGEASSSTKNRSQVENYNENWPEKGTIDFKNYYVKYRPNLPYVIQDFNLHINHGEKIGVAGRTGSGKSTLFLALLRILEPSRGAIYIDGVDISQLGLDDLRRKLTIIPQDPMLFKGTLRNNLDLLNKYNDEELWQSLEKVCMKEKFQQENGLDTEIKEGGENLSAGERQLLCIGRAILVQSKIILIDEATSNIDPNTEQTILDTIQKSFESCTVITVAHRLKTIINSDKILVMSEGRLLEFDSPQSLIENENSYFHKLWAEHEHAKMAK